MPSLPRLDHLNIRSRIRLIVVILIGAIAFGAWLDTTMLREALWREKELQTRHVVEAGYGVLAHFHELQLAGSLSETDAKAAAISTIRTLRYADTEYYWLSDMNPAKPRVIMHPLLPALENRTLESDRFNLVTGMRGGNDTTFTPWNGDMNLFSAFAEIVGRSGEGFVSYRWPKPISTSAMSEDVYPKLSFVKRFEPWGWVIGSGVYIDDVDRAISVQMRNNVLRVIAVGGSLLLLASVVARSITLPLRRTIRAIRATDGGNNRGQRLPINGKCELSELSSVFNDMLDRLATHEADLARHREDLEAAVAARTADLEDANSRLETELAERNRAERALRESRARVRALLDASGESVLLLATSGEILEINICAAQRFDATPETMTGLNFFDLIPADVAATRRQAVRMVAQTGRAMHLLDARGAIHFDNNLYPVKDDAGRVGSIAVYAKDITERHRNTSIESIFHRLDALLLQSPTDQESIARMFCQGIVPIFGLAGGWIGRADPDGRLTIVATSDDEACMYSALKSVELRWDGTQRCQPAARVIRERTHYIANFDDPGCSSCTGVLPTPDARASILLPLALRGKAWGVLTLYAQSVDLLSQPATLQSIKAVADRFGVSLESAAQQEWLALLNTALSTVANAAFITDSNARILWVNKALSRMSGYREDELVGATPRLFSSDVHDKRFHQQFWQSISSGKAWHGEIVNSRADGSLYTVEQTVTPLLDRHGHVSHYVAILEDITERKHAEERVRHSAHHDPLTDLPNRVLFLDRLGQALAMSRREERCGALLFLDLDHFKEVNDRLGHTAGDALLVTVAQRLSAQIRETDTVARLGGDEFTIILPGLRDAEDAGRLAEKVLASLSAPMDIARETLSIGVSIGIALFPMHGATIERLLNAADEAMYQAKRSGRNRFLYAPQPTPVD
ncbi:diguanylate cyclase [Azoarcus sp. L1K30]|uniref:diguanylate cyclase domain-containing protein n=1 Tax=Azoarcus sp. L1K30 TaxID=2820277 RepID=UPI001B821DF4|nr:diguanylate cyclase [Azoarcus sp. L1K30]MBR0565463.1 diguanylate cyclase [Azoarcus sp. L1K30]